MKPAPPALLAALPLLRCPHCTSALESTGSGVQCTHGHTFDRARHGYLTLIGGKGRRFTGDTVEQVAARERVFAAGVYDPILHAVGQATSAAIPVGRHRPVVLEPGAGIGTYLHASLDALEEEDKTPQGIGTDMSIPGVRRLSKTHPTAAAIVADTWDRLPLADHCVDVVQVVFAPRNPPEFARVLRQGGKLVVVVPAEDHLEPLRTTAGMIDVAAAKTEQLHADLNEHFAHDHTTTVDVIRKVPTELAVDIVQMGPSGVHLDRRDVHNKLGNHDHEVRLHVDVHQFRTKRPQP